MYTDLTNKQVRELSGNATKGVASCVTNAANVLLSPFAVCNQLKKEKSPDFDDFLTLFGLTRKKFGFNPETFGDHYVALDDNTHVLVSNKVDVCEVNKTQNDYEVARETYNQSDKGTDAKKVLRKATAKYDRFFTNLQKIGDYYYNVVPCDTKSYTTLLKLMIRERKTWLLAHSDETRIKAEKAKKRAEEKAQREAIKAEKVKAQKINDFKYVAIGADPTLSQDEISKAALQMYNDYVKAQQKTA